MKTFLVSILFLASLTASAQERPLKITCLIKTKTAEDGADRPSMKTLASETKEIPESGEVSFSGEDAEGTASFKVDMRESNIYIYITDRLSNRESATAVRGVDIRSPLFRVISGLSADSRAAKSREIVLNCLPEKTERKHQ